MKRKLIRQMCAEWRSNLWLMLELLIVGAVLYMLFLFVASMLHVRNRPGGMELKNLYIGRVATIPETATGYKPYADSTRNPDTDRLTLLDNLRSNPYVECIGEGYNAIPYNYSYWGTEFQCRVADDSVQTMGANMRFMTPELVKALRLRGKRGETPEQIAAMLEEGQILVSQAERGEYNYDASMWLGRRAMNNGDSTSLKTVGAVIEDIRRNDYEAASGTVVQNMLVAPDLWSIQVAIRVKDGRMEDFIQSLKAADMEFGNVYLTDLQTIDARRDNAQHEINDTFRNISACVLFLMLSVFLGFLGTFWYRTQQRDSELALRKVNGATNGDLMRRMISEGLLLLVIPALLLLGVIFWVVAGIDLEEKGMPAMPDMMRYYVWLFTVAALAVMIVAGIWFPARRAMRVQPALALQEQ